jgi:phosphoglycerate dehydrogenase-like enzyme
MKKVLLTPHSGYLVEDYHERISKAFLLNLERFVNGEELVNVVDL